MKNLGYASVGEETSSPVCVCAYTVSTTRAQQVRAIRALLTSMAVRIASDLYGSSAYLLSKTLRHLNDISKLYFYITRFYGFIHLLFISFLIKYRRNYLTYALRGTVTSVTLYYVLFDVMCFYVIYNHVHLRALSGPNRSVTGHNPSPRTLPPRSELVARPDKTHRITHRRLQS